MANAVRLVGFFTAISTVALTTMNACGSSDSKGGNAGTDAGGAATGGGGSGGGGTGGVTTGGTGGANADASTGGTSSDGGTQTCNAGDTCNFSCSANCFVECLGGDCTADCPDGGCALDADLGATANYTCSGGNCNTDCDGMSSCDLACAGGGCSLVCDGGSTCSVGCSDTGAPCTVTCEAGGVATCTGNCMMMGCGDGGVVCPPVDTSYTPTIDPANFTNVIDNQYFPLPVGATWTYGPPGEYVVVTVTDQTKVIMGVTCVVVHDTVYADAAHTQILEDTFDWYAQDMAGNVWYFGEDTKEYDSMGQVSSTAGSWTGGVDGAYPGIMMYASPMVGDAAAGVYREEYKPCEAEDQGQVLEINVTVNGTPTGDYTGCVKIKDFTVLEPANAYEIKTYCPGVGAISTFNNATMVTDEILTSVTGL